MTHSTADALTYYRQHGLFTDPAEHSDWLADLPQDVPGLCQVVQGLVIHVMGTRLYDAQLSTMQRKEVTIRF